MDILIITDEASYAHFRSNYVLGSLVDFWTADGHRVVLTADISRPVPADIAVLHVDATTISQDILDFCHRYPLAINGACASISKHLYSAHRLQRGSAYTGRVIVKTLANFGGYPEIFAFSQGTRLAWMLHQCIEILGRGGAPGRSIANRLWRRRGSIAPQQYPVFESIGEVPDGAWENPGLMVEKFLPERDNQGRYVLRAWSFFGAREFQETLVSNRPVVKAGSNLVNEPYFRRQVLGYENDSPPPVPGELHRVRGLLNMDYGRIDWVMHQGRPVVLDANKTISGSLAAFTDPALKPVAEKLYREFSRGLYDLLNGGGKAFS